LYFFDCHVSYGITGNRTPFLPAKDIRKVIEDMDRAKVSKAVVYRKEQLYGLEPLTGNRILAEDIAKYDNLYGLWSVIPSDTGEIEDPDRILPAMKKNKIIGWIAAPTCHRFSKKPFVLEDYFEKACSCNVPVFINTSYGYSLEDVAEILENFPKLTVVLTYDNIWPNDRYLRPFVRKYENVYLDLSRVITAGGLEDFTGRMGFSRLLYGSGYPDAYFGAGMLMILQSDIGDDDKEKIAYGNLEGIIGGIRYDQ
jgi:predicted TIM-barrel fold metal-dependent hydrolase